MANPPLPRVLDGVRLHVVTGKGGVGKTTVAAALALALSRQGRKVLLVEVEGRQGISQTFDVPPLGTEEVRLVSHAGGGELWGLSVDAKAALLEYLQTFYKLGRAGGALERMGVVDFATTVAPGVRDVLLTGKVYEAVGAAPGRSAGRAARSGTPSSSTPRPPDGSPASSRSTSRSPTSRASARSTRQAESITRMLKDRQTLVHVVTLLEEMPVQETADAVAELSAEGFGLGAVVVNQVREPAASTRASSSCATTDAARVEARVRDDLAAAGRPGQRRGPSTGLLSQGHDHAARVALEQLARGRRRRARPRRRHASPRSPRASRTAASRSSPTSSPGRGPADGARHLARRPSRSTSTPSSPTRRRASSSAAGPAAWARRRPRRRSGSGPPRPGRRVVVLTIDPARRLAQSLGLTELDNAPRPVAGVGAATAAPSTR